MTQNYLMIRPNFGVLGNVEYPILADKADSIILLLALRPGFLAGPSGIRAGQASNINGRLEVERPQALAGPPSGERAASLTPLSLLYSTGPRGPV